jgi:hypothetical protein
VADDINVVFGADTTQLDAAVGKVKSEMQSLVPGAPGSGILTPLPQAFGGAPSTLLERATAAAKANAAAAAQAGTAMKNYGLELEEAGNKAGRAGINFGAMAERLAARLVIFEAIRLAIQGIKYAVDQISNLQQAQIQFDAMSDGLDHLGARFEYLKKQAAAGLIPPEKAAQVVQTLQDYGASADEAQISIKALGQWSNVLGVDADKLAEALGRVSRGEDLEGTSGRLVTHMMGDQAAAGRALIQNLVELEKAQKRLETESAAVEKSMATQLRTTEQLGASIERSRSRGQEFLKQTGVLQDIQAQLPKLARMPESITPEFLQATGALKLPQMPPGTSQIVRNQVKDYITQYREGLAEIKKEEGLTSMAMRALAPTLPTDYIMSKAKEAHEDQMRNLREEDEATRAIIEGRKTAAGLAVTGAKAQIAAALPQAVTAPPTALWEQFTSSIRGSGDAVKQSIDTGIAKLVDAVGKAEKASQLTADHTESLYALLAGGT